MTRNEELCQMYLAGSTLQACGDHFKISRERVRQILRKAGIPVKHAGKSDRESFIGVNVTAESKEALKVKAKKHGVSVSRMVSDHIDEIVK